MRDLYWHLGCLITMRLVGRWRWKLLLLRLQLWHMSVTVSKCLTLFSLYATTTGLPNEEDAAEWLHQEPWKKCEAGRCTCVIIIFRTASCAWKTGDTNSLTSQSRLFSVSFRHTANVSPTKYAEKRGWKYGRNPAPVNIVSRHAATYSNP